MDYISGEGCSSSRTKPNVLRHHISLFDEPYGVRRHNIAVIY